MTRLAAIFRPAARLARGERGVVSVHNLFFTIITCCVGALAVDVTHFHEAKTQLQVSTDLAAHAALYNRRYGSYEDGIYHPLTDAEAEAVAIDAVEFGAPGSFFGPVIDGNQIVLGNWDYTTGLVVPDTVAPFETPDSAAVITDRAGANPVGSFLFQMAGIESVNVATAAVFTLGPGECDPTQGFFSQLKVEMNGNNTFYPGFCVGAPEIWVRNENMFRPGVSVVTPAADDLQLSNSDVDKHNPGLMDAFQYGSEVYDPVSAYMSSELSLVMNRDNTLPADFREHAYAYALLGRSGWTEVVSSRDMLTTPLAGGMTYTPSQLTPNTIYVASCTGGGPSSGIKLIDEPTNQTFRNIVILTNCRIDFDGSVKLEDVVISTTRNTGRPAIRAPASASGLTIGRDDDCDPEGGAALITRGIFDTAAQTNFYGALIRAGDRADFQSNAQGRGVSIIAGNGKVDTNSNISMKACGPAAGALSRDVSLRLRR